MNPNSLLALSEQFQKSAKFKDPFRNSEHDIEEALDYCSDFFKIKNLTEERSLINLPLEWLDIQKIPNFPTKDLYSYDDINSWIEVESGELRNLSGNDRKKFLKQLRNSHAVSWLEDGIPAIILVDFVGNRHIGDGRGRTNFAIGMGFQTVPVVILSLKPEYEDQIESIYD